MTIAACYLSSEGVVLGADSTTTMYVAGRGPVPSGAEHHFNFAQKIFQVGSEGALGMAMWGLGSLHATSYRTLIAEFSDGLQSHPASSMLDVANRWSSIFWQRFSSAFDTVIQRTQELVALALRTQDQDTELSFLLQTFAGGFCIAGNCLPDRTPQAFEITYSPDLTDPPAPKQLTLGSARFWGCPNLINRLIYGIDFELLESLMNSGKWSGTEDELIQLVQPHMLGQPLELPIREAIDWVHASIYATIKTMKFSHMAPVCGGPIEVAVITTDRPFRWVRHKRLDAAIAYDGFTHV